MQRLLRRPALGALLAFCAACSGEKGPVPGTPLEALVEFNRALGRGDLEAARRWCLPGEVQEEFLRNSFEMTAAARAFQAKVIETWGEAEMQRFLEHPGAMLHMDFQIPEEQLLAAVITEMGPVAYATLEGGLRVRIARTQDGWRCDGVGSEHPQEIAWMRLDQQYALGIAAILRRAIEKIDALPKSADPRERALQAETLDLEMGRVLQDHETSFQEMLQAMQAKEQASAAERAAAEVGPAPPAPR